MDDIQIIEGGDYAQMLQAAEAAAGVQQVVWYLDHFEIVNPALDPVIVTTMPVSS